MEALDDTAIYMDEGPYKIMTYEEHQSLALAIKSALSRNQASEFFHECLSALREEFPDVGEEVIRSIFAFEYEKGMKKKHMMCIKIKHELHEKYLKYLDSMGRHTFVLVRLAHEVGLAPALLVRLILEVVYGEDLNMRDVITDMMRRPRTIPNSRLSAEVETCLISDEFYGPEVDQIKIVVGAQFELLLQAQGKAKGLRFIEETGSRGEGFDKTPDLKLVDPVMLDGTMIHWIESKAVFADEELHQKYVIQQYARYHARYGPGLVIYWYGFVETILFTTNVNIIISLDFPSDAISLIPKGKSVRGLEDLAKCLQPNRGR